MKHRNNFTYKMNCMMKFIEGEEIPDSEELREIQKWAADKNPAVRCMAARVLALRSDMAENERLLRGMTYDRNRWVRKAAVENLIIGRSEESLKRLKILMQKQNNLLTRTYAVSSHFSVWVNIYGYHKDSMERYLKETEELYRKQKENLPLIAYEMGRYRAGKRDSLIKMKQILQGGKQVSREEQEAVVAALDSLRKLSNREEIDAILEETCMKVSDGRLKENVLNVLKKPVIPMVMVLDRKNSGISQLLEYLAFQDIARWRILVFSFGLEPAEQMDYELRSLLKKEEDCDIEKYQHPQKIWEQEYYDYIVPLGVRLRQEDYSFQKIIPLFENMDENILDAEKAKRMLDELKAYIDNDLKRITQ